MRVSALPLRGISQLCLAVARHCESAHCLSSAAPYIELPLHRGPFRCHAPLRCRLCPAAAPQLNALPMRCDSLRNHAPATPRNAPALPLHSWPKRRRAYRCPRGSVPSIATALPSLAHASHRPALPSRSAQRRAIPRHCLAGLSNATPLPSVAVSAVPSLCDADFTLPLRRTPRIAAALICITFAWHSMLFLATAPPSCAKP